MSRVKFSMCFSASIFLPHGVGSTPVYMYIGVTVQVHAHVEYICVHVVNVPTYNHSRQTQLENVCFDFICGNCMSACTCFLLISPHGVNLSYYICRQLTNCPVPVWQYNEWQCTYWILCVKTLPYPHARNLTGTTDLAKQLCYHYTTWVAYSTGIKPHSKSKIYLLSTQFALSRHERR